MVPRILRASALAALVACALAAPASAATFNVATTADGPDSDINGFCATGVIAAGPCSLRGAIMEANATAAADTIVLPAGQYNLTIPIASQPDQEQGDLDITQPVTIDGAGARSTTVMQTQGDRVFQTSVAAQQTMTLEGVTVSGGNLTTGNGGGILNSGSLSLVDSAVRGQETPSAVSGAGIANTGSMLVERSLITDNHASGTATGGGILNGGGTVLVRNSTISGNTASNGSAVFNSGEGNSTALDYVTVTNNSSSTPGGAALMRVTAPGGFSIRGSIVAINPGTGGNCASAGAGTPFVSSGNNVESGNSCGFTAAGDRQNADPGIAPLGYSSPTDQTETHVPQLGSPALDGGGATCTALDQRMIARPQGPACEIGAVEIAVQPPPGTPALPSSLAFAPTSANRTPGDTNTVTATVRNSDGSAPANAPIRYSIAGPNDGNGNVATDSTGNAQISWEGVREGTDTLSAYVDTNGNLNPDAGEPTAQATVSWTLPAPAQGRSFNIEPVSGTVRITLPRGARGRVVAAGGSTTRLLNEAQQVPIGTKVDVRRGRVQMTTVANNRGGVQTGQFYGGIYTTVQSRSGSRPVTEMRLSEQLACVSGRSKEVTASRTRKRRLWGNARGRYRTRGRHSTATVRGTIWLQQDTCTRTTTVVRSGTVVVRDFGKDRNVTVRAGRRYTARRR